MLYLAYISIVVHRWELYYNDIMSIISANSHNRFGINCGCVGRNTRLTVFSFSLIERYSEARKIKGLRNFRWSFLYILVVYKAFQEYIFVIFIQRN